ncbi:hypothetical protein MCSF7_03033 [Mycoplasmopsis columbina SF7]|uniref:Uncharacterized protein n=1 Tax=Mycoplasmopsis columbina SF7 TaxID=1037410 RepID=F9UJE8_9BACT|nr:hypothetical protein [Mycoplasmopsis columbina]EGV00491.1 hypothetical protein MCSF7_03033 [Mycoplasmopsis columbina SF7]
MSKGNRSKNINSSSNKFINPHTFITFHKMYETNNFFANVSILVEESELKDVKNINLSINNKYIDENLYKNDIYEDIYDGSFLNLALENYVNLNDHKYKLFSIKLRPEILGINLEELENFTVTIDTKNDIPFHYFQIRKRNKDLNPLVINKKVNELAQINIPYLWTFSISNSMQKMKSFNDRLVVRTLPFDQFKHKRDLLITNYDSKFTHDPKIANDEYTVPQWPHPEVKNFSINAEKFAKFYKFYYQSWPFHKGQGIYELSAFENNTIAEDTNLDYKITKNTHEIKKDEEIYSLIKKHYLNNYYEYDYENQKLSSSSRETEKGYIIPYSFKGELMSSFLLQVNYSAKNNKKDWLKIIVNSQQNVPLPLLDSEIGKIKIHGNFEESSFSKELKYKVDLTQSEIFVSTVFNDPLNFENWKA